jgi:hypothetical protein
MSEITRFDLDMDGSMEPSEHGRWVRYEDAQRQRVVFPTMLRKMWSGGEVQAWLDENVNKDQHHE